MNDMPPMDNMGDNGMGGEFDTNFDAGVDASEETDPKKYIQQLTGKLSQSLRNYTNEQGQADAELNKYVAGMIIKQAIEGLNGDDVEDILNKVKSNDEIDNNESGDMPSPEMNNDMALPQDDQSMEEPQPQQQMPMESVNRKNNKKIDEIFQELTNTDTVKNGNYVTPVKRKQNFKQKPFTSPF